MILLISQVLAEISSVLNVAPESSAVVVPTSEQLQKLNYLQCVVMETLRYVDHTTTKRVGDIADCFLQHRYLIEWQFKTRTSV